MNRFDLIAFDADDTLWHSEALFQVTQSRFVRLLSKYPGVDGTEQKLLETELRNLPLYGYGIKGFTLSMIETAIELTGGQIQGRDVKAIIELAWGVLRAPVRLLDHVEETVAALSASHRLMVITKGELLYQESKLKRSGLTDYFTHVEIVSEKTSDTYRSILAWYGIDAQRFLMVGNSLKSDVLPVVAIGGQAVYVPYHIIWEHETVTDPQEIQADYFELEHIGLLPALVKEISAG